jgi:hypothetical protein
VWPATILISALALINVLGVDLHQKMTLTHYVLVCVCLGIRVALYVRVIINCVPNVSKVTTEDLGIA